MIKVTSATDDSDRKIHLREWTNGRNAAVKGLSISDCPWHGGLTEKWWKDGFNFRNPPAGMIKAQ